jgi:hypothetical protein
MTTIQQAHDYFEIELDKRGISAAPSFLHDEIDYFINTAYITLIKQKFTGNNKLQQSFEESTKRIADLQGLVLNVALDGLLGDEYAVNECKFEVTNQSEVMFPVSFIFQYNSSSYNPGVFVERTIMSKFRKSDINNPWIPVPTGIYENNSLLVCIDPVEMHKITGDYPKVIFTYVKYPIRMDYTNAGQAFEVGFVDEIIALAVDYALDNIEAQRIQIHTRLTQNKE